MFFQDNRRAKAAFTLTMLLAFSGVFSYVAPQYSILWQYIVVAVTAWILWEISQL